MRVTSPLASLAISRSTGAGSAATGAPARGPLEGARAASADDEDTAPPPPARASAAEAGVEVAAKARASSGEGVITRTAYRDMELAVALSKIVILQKYLLEPGGPMRLGIHLNEFSWPGGPASLRHDLGQVVC